MEIIIYSTLTLLMWIISLSLLLPVVLLLKFSKAFRDIYFSWFYVRIWGSVVNPELVKLKKQAFIQLKDHLRGRKRHSQLQILEIGIGEGENLQFYPENSNLTVVDMNESFVNYFEVNRQKYPHVTLKKTVVGMAEDMHKIEDDSFDVVICTYVLCSVENLRSVLNEIKRVLKPGGVFLFVEHIPYPVSSWLFTLEKCLAPLWKIYLNGCILTRKIDDEIMNTGFTDVVMDRHNLKDMWLTFRPHITGIATK